VSPAEIQRIEIDGLTLGYRELGAGAPVLLLHGWPTSSWLWRDVMEPISRSNRVIALDLPGFGASDKPLDQHYGFRYFDGVLDGFLAALEIERLSLAVHDLGGPVGVHWVIQNQARVERLALLNTLLYPQTSWAVKVFVAACTLPLARGWITSPAGIRFAMRLGVNEKSLIEGSTLEGYQAPFESKEARRALAATGRDLGVGGLKRIEAALPNLRIPVRIIYGEDDRILPDVAKTMTRVSEDVGGAEITGLADVGHFCQEERGTEIGELLAAFFGEPATAGG
jgi:haloalkane dehalogenase